MRTNPMNLVTDLQNEIAEHLARIWDFTGRDGLDIITERKGDLESLMLQRLNKLGVGIVVFTPTIKAGDFDRRIDVEIIFEVDENVTINQHPTGYGTAALDICVFIIGLLRPEVFIPHSGFCQMVFEGVEAVQTPWEGTIGYQVKFHTSTIIEVRAVSGRSSIPVIGGEAGDVIGGEGGEMIGAQG